MYINSLMINPGSTIYYDKKFRTVLEDHMQYLRVHVDTRQVTVKSKDAYKYAGDLFGLLQLNNIAPEYHWIIMRLNKYTSPSQVRDTIQTLLIPDLTLIERIRNVYNTKNSLSY